MMAYKNIFLALGSNLGNRINNLQAAIDGLKKYVKVTAQSRLFETAPMYVTDQPKFINMAIACECDLSAYDLLDRLKSIEKAVGRVKTRRFGPRIADIDILFFDGEVIRSDDDSLIIPHPRLHERAFVLRPLMDLCPDFIHPISKKSVQKLYAEINVDNSDEIYALNDILKID